jgi:Predicted integral membrane protein
MILFVNLINALDFIVSTLVSMYSFIVLGYCIISWVNPDPYNPIVRLLRNLTEPALWRIRKHLPFVHTTGMDFSPIVLILGIQLLDMVVFKTIFQGLRSLF